MSANRTREASAQPDLVPILQLSKTSVVEGEPFVLRLPLMVSRSAVREIDEWRYTNHVLTRAEAIRRLIELGSEAAKVQRAPL